VWNGAGNILTVTLSTASGVPSVATGDTITLDGATITDGTNGSATAASPAISGTFTSVVPPTLTALSTADTDSDGFIDRLIATFDRGMDETTIVPAKFSTSRGGIISVTDDGVAADAVIWVNLADGVLNTGFKPKLSIAAGGIEDVSAMANGPITAYSSADGAPPVLLHTLAVVGEKTVYAYFSESVSGNGAVIASGDFLYSDGGNPIMAVTPINLSGNYSESVFISLSQKLSAGDVLLPHTVSPVASAILDRAGLAASAAAHRVSDLLLGSSKPIWASNVGSVRTITRFTGGENLEHADVRLQAYDDSGGPLQIFFDSNVSSAMKANRVWLPQFIPGLVSQANGGAQILAPYAVASPLNDFSISQAATEEGVLEFGFEVGGLYCLRVVNPKDPRTLAMWSVSIKDINTQSGGITVLNNVLNPRLGGKTTVAYTLSQPGTVTILVSDLKGDVVVVLTRGFRLSGEHSVVWDGRNRGKRIVAPGLYYVKIVGPGINEVRKVLVAQ
jgi:hypothetical protein